MASFDRRVKRNPYLTLAASSLTTSYVLIGILPTSARQIKFKNRTNGAVDITYDRVNAMVNLVAGESNVDDLTGNAPSNSDVFNEPSGRSYYAKWSGAAPVSPVGDIYIETIAAESGA